MNIDRDILLNLTTASSLLNTLTSLISDIKVRKNFEDQTGIVLPEQVLFHGSKEICSSLELHISEGGENESKHGPLIYATDEPEYGIFLAILDIKDGMAGVYFDDNDQIRLWIDTDFQNGASGFSRGVLHIVDGMGFKQEPNHEFTIDEKVTPLFCVEVCKEDLVSEIDLRSKKI